MRIVREAADLERWHGGVFVPTMGALHGGHAALIRRAGDLADGAPLVVSIFVNPTQFNEPSDFDRYPRSFEEDVLLCECEGADIVFAPTTEAVYPPGATAAPPELPEVATRPGLEDAHRPGHFAGVCQVCVRLFGLVRPRCVVMGEKDWQQLAVLKALIAREGTGVNIVGHPTVREADGLAMSSRNRLLSDRARVAAGSLVRALVEAGRHRDSRRAEDAGRRILDDAGVETEYLVVRDAQTLGPAREGSPARVLVAARAERVRLIDNAPWPGFTLPA